MKNRHCLLQNHHTCFVLFSIQRNEQIWNINIALRVEKCLFTAVNWRIVTQSAVNGFGTIRNKYFSFFVLKPCSNIFSVESLFQKTYQKSKHKIILSSLDFAQCELRNFTFTSKLIFVEKCPRKHCFSFKLVYLLCNCMKCRKEDLETDVEILYLSRRVSLINEGKICTLWTD